MIAQFTSRRTCTIAAAWLLAAMIGSPCAAGDLADELAGAYPPLIEPAKWQVVETEVPPNAVPSEPVLPLPPAPVPAVPVPAVPVPVEPIEELPATPLLDDAVTEEELIPPLGADDPIARRRGVRPYGGGRPDDWPWGCGGSPFRTGPGYCDTWDVGCRWNVAVDGMVMMREDANLLGLEAGMRAMDITGTEINPMTPLIPAFEQFDYGPGGRVSFISKVPHYPWQMHAGYEGIEEWNASVVFPKTPLDVFLLPPPGSPNPPTPVQLATEQRRLHYRSSLHSGELNFVRDYCSRVWRPYCGVRYVKFDDEINDFIDQQAPPPLPDDFAGGATASVTTTDRLNLFDIENNLIGFQIGIRHDLWRPMRRLSIEGFVNAGVYYNKVKHTNLMATFTTQQFADDSSTLDDNEFRTDFSDVANNDVRELSEISYIAEASLSGVCRLNKCWALRAGYQALWITDLHIAEDAYLNTGVETRDLFFHGWHAGVEHRR